MTSYETTEKLKEAGLEWEPKNGDFFWHDGKPLSFCYECLDEGIKGNSVWLPKLSQLLEEIEKRGYWPNLRKVSELFTMNYELSIHRTGEQRCEKRFTFHEVEGETWEEAAALALLWIMENEK